MKKNLSRFSLVLVSVVCLTLFSTIVFAQSQYQLTDVGAFGSGFTMAFAINNQNQVVGGGMSVTPFLWQNDTFTDLGSLSTIGPNGNARSINDAGQIVGETNIDSLNANQHAFLWQNGVMQDLTPLDLTNTFAWDINNNGQVVINANSGNSYLWQDGQLTNIGQLSPSLPRTLATSINDSGQIAGYAFDVDANTFHAFIWQTGVFTDLGSLGGSDTRASAINEAGHVVGFSRTADGNRHAFLWQNGAMTDLGTLGGATSQATAINNTDQVVGFSQKDAGPFQRAFVWQDGILTDLGALDSTVNADGSFAFGINDAGIIVGASTTASGSHAVLWTIVPGPEISPLLSATISEGDIYTTYGSFADADATSWTATVDYGDGFGEQPLALDGTNFAVSHQYGDDGAYTVTVTVTNNLGETGTGTATITVENAAPSIGTITAPNDATRVNAIITASAAFTDAGSLDTHTATWNWGDGTTSAGYVTESSGSGAILNTHTYSQAGLYTIILTAEDDDGGSSSAQLQYAVIFDLDAGILKGKGAYQSQAGWITQHPQATGQVKFEVQARYKHNNTLPSGETALNFSRGNIHFESTSYQWLVVTGAKAILKGTGTINGSGNYTFLFSAVDGHLSGGQDLIRIKISDASNNVVYDTQTGAPDDSDPTTILLHGSIKIH